MRLLWLHLGFILATAADSRSDESPCSLVWPRFGNTYIESETIYVMFYCLLSEADKSNLRERSGNYEMIYTSLAHDGSVFVPDVNQSVTFTFSDQDKAITQEFKLRPFIRYTSLRKFIFKILIGDNELDKFSTVIEIARDVSPNMSSAFNNCPSDGNCSTEPVTRHYDFIEIGTSGFDTLIQLADNSHFGLSVEPLKQLQNMLPDRRNVRKVSSAIGGSSGWMSIYYVDPDFLNSEGISIDEDSDDRMLYGIGRMGEMTPIFGNIIKKTGYLPAFLMHTKRDLVPIKTVNQLFSEHNVDSVLYLKLDCEGFDNTILRAALTYFADNKKTYPTYIEFENNSDFSGAEQIILSLLQLRYNIYSYFWDAIAVGNESFAVAHGVVYAEVNADVSSRVSLIPKEFSEGRRICDSYYERENPINHGLDNGKFCVLMFSPSGDLMQVDSKFKKIV
jgi:FkbM family methyltransferase